MIKQISLRNFKKFASVDIKLNANDLSIFAGGNSSGKTSILHALAVWEYAKILLVNNRGHKSLNAAQANRGKGLGISPTDFSPIDIPSLRSLWYKQNTQGSYGMSIKVVWDSDIKNDAYLEISFTLNGNNFAIKNSSSNLVENENIPTVAYLPPFAGISSHENKVSLADMRTLIGKGLAGAVIRNLLISIYIEHQTAYRFKKEELLRGRSRLPKNQRNELDNIPTAWNKLNRILIDIFRVKLLPHEFDERFHNYINIDIIKVDVENDVIIEDKESIQDLMMEGSGFLQWLSVFTFAIDGNNDVLLLDEPDAHLHRALQSQMMNALKKLIGENSKQILIVSHNSELIEYTEYHKILFVRNSQVKYLNNDLEKVPLLEGLGSDYFPLLSKIKQHKRIIFLENDSDWRVLKVLCEKSGRQWPTNLVEWITNKKHAERKHIMIELAQKCIAEANQSLIGYSLRDLDDENYNTVNDRLIQNGGSGEQRDDSGNHVILYYRTLRRREIENYLIIPDALSRYLTSKKRDEGIDTSVAAINAYLLSKHGLVIPSSYRQSDRDLTAQSLFSNDVKPVLNGIKSHFRISFSKDDYIEQILQEEICDDINLIIDEIIQMCN